MVNTTITENDIWQVLATVNDPEVPVLSILDLGIVRNVTIFQGPDEKGFYGKIAITPTYSGCPAMDVISLQIKLSLAEHNIPPISIIQQLSPAWTTDWMSEAGKQKLVAYGIAAPIGKAIDQINLEALEIPCPQCNSINTRLISQFGSTACKALFQCNDCKEPFDYFKCH